MRSRVLFALVVLSAAGCASLTPEGARVRVYEADSSAPPSSRALPSGCRLVAPAEEPTNQMESERQVTDPYRLQRNAAAEKGGNVLLVLSRQILARPKTDCAVGDSSPECVSRGENWYRVAFEAYACDESALRALESLPPEAAAASPNLWPFGRKKPAARPAPPPASGAPPSPTPAVSTSATAMSPADLERKVLSLMGEGLGSDLIAAYVRGQRLARALTAEEIVEWKRAGIAEPVIEAAVAQATR